MPSIFSSGAGRRIPAIIRGSWSTALCLLGLFVYPTTVHSQVFDKLPVGHSCSYFGEPVPHSVHTFSSDKEAEGVIRKIVAASGLVQNFVVRSAGVPNAAATIRRDKRFILYNQYFMRKMKKATGSPWAAVSIMAHEIGHHLNGHTLDNRGSRPSIELEADYYSGFILQKLGGTLDQARIAMTRLGSETGSSTHPPKRDRLAAITNGWTKSCELDPACGGRTPADPERQDEESRKSPVRKKPGRAFRDCDQCPELVVVPAGSFEMGSPDTEEGRDYNEGPVHRVTIPRRLAVGVYEVTFEEWDACLKDGGCKHDSIWGDRGWGRGRRPVIDVTWEEARSYVDWLSRKTGKGYRLLSESEWEYVARAGTVTPFHTGRTIATHQANFDGGRAYGAVRRRQTLPVGSFQPNAFGLYDVHGNVREWVEDCSNLSYRGKPSDGRAWTNSYCISRVLRGGSWRDDAEELRSASRDSGTESVTSDDRTGFRVVRTTDE